jgi:hypothetical protein
MNALGRLCLLLNIPKLFSTHQFLTVAGESALRSEKELEIT